MSRSTCTLFNLQRFSTEDGPGLRTTLFFKGCPLTCPWCHNPEGISPGPELLYKQVTCIGCGDCRKACSQDAIELDDQGVHVDLNLCDHCFACVEACPTNSLEAVGIDYELEELVQEVLKDRSFFETSGGGVTLSGGEPLMHLSFIGEFLRRCRQEKIHVALDTSGMTRREWFGPVLNWLGLVLFDVKLMDPEAHRKITGAPLELVLSNLERASKKGLPIWVRTPVIPGFTDSEDNLRNIARYLKREVPSLQRYDLLAFSNLCESKYRMMGKSFPLAGQPLLSKETMDRMAAVVRDEGIESVRWSGPTRNDGQPEEA
jgi:pyruvate formate lyase activating enzyme